MLSKLLGGRYQITKHLGGGGFGQTYLADDLHLPGNPSCVVKHLKPQKNDAETLQAARRLFDTEAQVLYSLGNHDQIPRLFAHFEEDQDFFLVQEFVDGAVFNQELKSRPPFSESEVLHLLQDVLTVLEFVHQQQVIHRDIKPSNLIRRSSDRHLVLIDFGAVKQISMPSPEVHQQATLTVAVGSSHYMPNEQLAGMPRFCSDLYSLGVVAIQCLTGMYLKKLPEDPQTSEILWRDRGRVSPELGDFLDKMVRYDFRQRYPTAKEALADLQALTGAFSVLPLLSEPKPVGDDGYLAWLERGDELFQSQRYNEAIAAYNKVIQVNPEDDVAWFKRGIALENLQFYEEAVASFDHVLQLQPQDYLAWYKQGNAWMQLQRYPEALQSFEQVVQIQPDNYWVWLDRGKVLEGMERYEEAVASYDRAVQIESDFQLAIDSRKRLLSQLKQVDTLYHLQHYDEAVAACDRTLQENPQDAAAWFMRGMALENLHQPEDAIAAYQQVVQIQPEDHIAWFKQGSLLETLNQLEAALTAYHRVVQLQPTNYWAWHDRGKLLEKLGEMEDAIACYDRVVQLKPDFQAANEGRARILNQLHPHLMPPTAAEEKEDTLFSESLARRAVVHSGIPHGNATQVNATQVNATQVNVTQVNVTHGNVTHGNVTHVNEPLQPCNQTSPVSQPLLPEDTYIDQGAEQPTIAHKSLLTAEETSDQASEPADDCLTWFAKGRALEKLEDYPAALQAFDRALQLCTDNVELWHSRANLLSLLGRHREAAIAYRQALTLKPYRADLWCCMGGCLVRSHQYHAAISAFDQTILLQPNQHVPWYWRGRALFELRQYAEAIQSFERAIAVKPDFKPAIADRTQAQKLLKH